MNLCNLCPRSCNVNRDQTLGFCSVKNTLKISRAALHFWEEPCISAEDGSGTVFFSGCNMKCVFCQNKEISTQGFGKEITVQRLADIFCDLQKQGALNINLVTPTHYTLQIIQAVNLAKQNGLNLPIIYNTSGYETVETLQMLENVVDVYLPDFKYSDNQLAAKYSFAPNYVQVAKAALAEMVRQQPKCVFDGQGIIQKGVIVRHLVLPGFVAQSKNAIAYLYQTYQDKIFISIMSQYTPCTDLQAYPELNRTVTDLEYQQVVDYAIELGLEQGFVQEGQAADESFIPPFDLTGVD